jgi:stress-induced morphogen
MNDAEKRIAHKLQTALAAADVHVTDISGMFFGHLDLIHSASNSHNTCGNNRRVNCSQCAAGGCGASYEVHVTAGAFKGVEER